MTTIQRFGSSKDYFENVLEPNFRAFMDHPSTFQNAFNMAASLFHMRDWVYACDKRAAERALGATFDNEYKLWDYVETKVSGAGFIRDVANASKHVILDRGKPSTGMTHIVNTSIVSVGFGTGTFGTGHYGGAPSVFMEEGGPKSVSLDSVAEKVFEFWKELIATMYPTH